MSIVYEDTAPRLRPALRPTSVGLTTSAAYWQMPPQQRGAPQASPRGATGSEPPFMFGAEGALINRLSLVLPHCGHSTLSSADRTSNSTSFLQPEHSYS